MIFLIILAALSAPSDRPFHIDTRQNPAIVTFDNGCVVRVYNGDTPNSSPKFSAVGPCDDWRKYCHVHQ